VLRKITTVKSSYSTLSQPSLMRRSMLGTIVPRRLITRLMNSGVPTMRVASS